jgi:membrane associated rhomboid family serine protease
MLPISDLNPTRRFPIVNYALIAINFVVFVGQLGMSEQQLTNLFLTQAVVPAQVSGHLFAQETLLDIIRSMFFHGGWAHILGNMLYLWIFGDNVEDRMGSIMYLIFYLLCGFAAAYAQVFISPNSPIPLVGASGAIAGVLGSYLVLYPGVKVRGIIFLGVFSRIAEISAIWVLGFWFVMQLFDGVASLGPDTQSGGVAFFAHVGGFVVGIILTFLFTLLKPQPPGEQRSNMLYQRYGR